MLEHASLMCKTFPKSGIVYVYFIKYYEIVVTSDYSNTSNRLVCMAPYSHK